MNVLLVHRHDYGGGGGNIAMVRLHRGLSLAGVESRILCGRSRLDQDSHSEGLGVAKDSVEIPRPPVVLWLEDGLRKVTRRMGLDDLHAVSSFGISRLEEYRWADVVDFHCIHGGFFNYLSLPCLTRRKAAVFTLHDMWPFTGHCFYSLECERWRTGCGECPHLEMGPSVERDATAVDWRLKNWAYEHSDFHVVAPSRWMAREAGRSILGRFPITVIPNAVDLEVYRPRDPIVSRQELGIGKDRLVLMIASLNLDDPRKGSDLLLEALRGLPTDVADRSTLLMMGRHSEALVEGIPIHTVSTGYLTDPDTMARAYSAADVFVHSSRADNHPLVLVESLACGTPMVGFRVGGVPELIRQEETGLLADPGNAEALGREVLRLLGDASLRRRMALECRRTAVREHDIRLYTRRYLAVYRRAMGQGAEPPGASSRCSSPDYTH